MSPLHLLVIAPLLGVALGQLSPSRLQVIGNNVVDENFTVVGELAPGETLLEFLRSSRPNLPSEPLGLSAGASDVLRNIMEGFSCEGLPYGYYSDPENSCQVFHICNPINGGTGQGGKTLQYSFFCNDGLEFDQRLLTCVRPSGQRSSGCGNARSLYASSNSRFGRKLDAVDDAAPNVVGIVKSDDVDEVIMIGVSGGVPVSALSDGLTASAAAPAPPPAPAPAVQASPAPAPAVQAFPVSTTPSFAPSPPVSAPVAPVRRPPVPAVIVTSSASAGNADPQLAEALLALASPGDGAPAPSSPGDPGVFFVSSVSVGSPAPALPNLPIPAGLVALASPGAPTSTDGDPQVTADLFELIGDAIARPGGQPAVPSSDGAGLLDARVVNPQGRTARQASRLQAKP